MTKLQPGHELSKKHGGYQLVERGIDALWDDERVTMAELQAELSTPAGIRAVYRFQTVMQLLVCRRIERYIEEEMKAGVPLEELSIAKSYPAFQNTLARMLKQLNAMTPGADDGKDVITMEDLEKE